jgi:exodeoxyribonuclease VII large subunit
VDRPAVLTVSQLTRLVKTALEQAFPPIWVEGEISGFREYASGHCYFTLKDHDAQISAVMFKREAVRLPFRPVDGMHVLVFGRITVYEKRGIYQIVAEDVEPRGVGAIQEALRKLRDKLEGEGLFAPERKRALPLMVAKVGVVTSPSGAAIRDILKVFQGHDTAIHVILSPTAVQGAEAPSSIVEAIQSLVSLGGVDVIIVGRGGGSFEDLLAFSDESVVRTVAESPIPTISAVGHEVDVALTDLAADVRAATPTAAAQIIALARLDLISDVGQIALRMASAMSLVLDDAAGRVRSAEDRLVHPRYLLVQGRMRLDDQAYRLQTLLQSGLVRRRGDMDRLNGMLTSLDPLAVLKRGYALVQKGDGEVVRGPEQVEVEERLAVTLSGGKIGVEVTDKGKGSSGK